LKGKFFFNRNTRVLRISHNFKEKLTVRKMGFFTRRPGLFFDFLFFNKCMDIQKQQDLKKEIFKYAAAAVSLYSKSYTSII